jgi:hypothetical protein
MGRRHGDPIAGNEHQQGGHQHLTALQAIPEEAHQQHGGRLSQGGDAGCQGQRGALHLKGLSGLHQGCIGHTRVDQLQAGQNAEEGHRQGSGGSRAHGVIKKGGQQQQRLAGTGAR